MAHHSSDASLSLTAHIILAMVAEGHSDGNTIKAEIEQTTRRYRTAGVRSIYPELHRLHAAGLLSWHGDPLCRSYQITDRGRYTHRLWLLIRASRCFTSVTSRFCDCGSPAGRGPSSSFTWCVRWARVIDANSSTSAPTSVPSASGLVSSADDRVCRGLKSLGM